MEQIIAPVDKALLRAELTTERFLRRTRKANNEIYIFSAHECPNLMREVGRLREIAFRHDGGGTGKSIDIDHFDTMETPYMQLIVWNPDDEEILGGYRYIVGDNVKIDEQGAPVLATSHMFGYSDQFMKEYLPYMIELGRSFVTLEYQSSKAGARGLFALDNLWDGLGALVVNNPQVIYFFGKFTMYPSYCTQCRDMLLYFLRTYFPDPERLVYPFNELQTNIDEAQMKALFPHGNFKEDYKILNQEIRKNGQNIPPLVNAYMSLSPTMKMFGTAVNDEFGDVEESGILIRIDEILAEKRARYIDTYIDYIETLKDA